MMIDPNRGRELQRRFDNLLRIRFARDPGNRLLHAACHYDYNPSPDPIGHILNTLRRAQADADDAAMMDALCRAEAELDHCLRVVGAGHLLGEEDYDIEAPEWQWLERVKGHCFDLGEAQLSVRPSHVYVTPYQQ
jgi:hypothetical protein